MAEASDENAMPAPIQENTPPDPNYSFYIKMKPLQTLKDAIEALLDPNFNNDGFGIVEVDSDSLAIWVEDNDNATATLLLKSSGMIEFQNYVAPLRLISQGFPRDLDGDDDTVIIFHVKGTNRLHFEFETVPPSGIWAEIVENPDAAMYPNVLVFTEITLPVDDIREMSNYMLLEKDPSNDDTVHIDWKESFVTFDFGSDKKWEYAFEEATELEKREIFHGWFNWRYIRFMREACILADKVTVYFLTVPEQHVLFQFHVAKLANLFLLQKAAFVLPDLSVDED